MICALAVVACAPPPVMFDRTLWAPGAVTPASCHCCVGAAFQRKIPPKVLSPRLSLASVVALDSVGCVVAKLMKAPKVVARAVIEGNAPPSEFGLARAEPAPVARVEALTT